MRRGAFRRLPILLACALAVTACTDKSDGASPSTSTSAATSTSSTTSTTTSQEREVLDAYQGYWKAILAANDPPDQFHPDLKKYATGAAFDSVFNAAQANRVQGHALRLPPDSKSKHDATVEAIQGDQATVRDCAVDDGLVVEMSTGRVINADVSTRLVTATLVKESGTWKVRTTRVDESWKGVAGCAAG